MEVTNSIKYVGVDDTTIDYFESQYPMEEEVGISYNSYVILDDKIAIMDTVDKRCSDEWLRNVDDVLEGKTPDYLIVQHLEPDHSGTIQALVEKFPDMEVVCSAKAKAMMPQFFEFDTSKVRGVAEGETLELGSHTLQFMMAPMVHWPEVMVTYDQCDKVLFSADGFGTFGAIKNNIPWEQEASHYYLNIVGKYGASVQGLLKKAAALDIQMICPLHGPVLKDDLSFYIDKYNTWSSYEPEIDGILVCHASAHGNTKKAAEDFAE
ncbi:MAG: MBL fold metallo-hydrolase, partial [Lachnospiraceae bacterium]|nr:MBL fold metallo-hydrolase [Lachnospiraceae bacterium]